MKSSYLFIFLTNLPKQQKQSKQSKQLFRSLLLLRKENLGELSEIILGKDLYFLENLTFLFSLYNGTYS